MMIAHREKSEVVVQCGESIPIRPNSQRLSP